jgi:hypothetical protein
LVDGAFEIDVTCIELIAFRRINSTKTSTCIHPPEPMRSRASEIIGRERANMPPHRRRAVERLLSITLEKHGIFVAQPKE